MPQQPPDSPVVAVEDKALDKESMIELLGEDDNQETIELDESPKKVQKDKEAGKEDKGGKPSKGDSESKGKTEETPEEEELTLEDELEDEFKELDDDKLELIDAPSRREILTAYPDLFKKFPQLEKSMYREKAYSEILPTIEDARQAVSKAELLDEYEKEIMSGSTESLLTTVRDSDKEAYAKVVDNYLPTLYKVDQHSYYHTIGNVIKHTIVSMVRDSKQQGNEELGTAASVLNQYIFGTTQFSPPQNLSKDSVQDDNSREKEETIARKEREFTERQYTSARDDLGQRVDGILKASVDKAIDPNESMTEYVRKYAVKEVLSNLEDLVSKDTRFKGIYDKLWERAFDNDFDKESMDKIKSAYLSKAKTLLPLLIKKSRNEALRGLNRTNKDDSIKDRKGPLPVGKTRSSTTPLSGKSNSNSGAKSIPRGMSTLDYLNSDD